MQYKTANNEEEFMNNAKPYFANMEKNRKMIHRKGCPKCQYSKFMYRYIDFETLAEAESFRPRLSKCQNCFPEQ